MEMMVKRRSPHLGKLVSTSCTERNQRWKQVQSMSFEIDWEHWRSRVASRGPTYVAKGTTTRGPGLWVTNYEFAIDRLSVQSWINVIKQDWGDRISPTINDGGRSVLIWGRTCRTLLGDKGKPLSGDKGARTNKCIRAQVQTELYTRTDWIEVRIIRAVNGKWMILRKRRPRFVGVRSAHSFW